LPPLVNPDESLASPQSLFRVSPDPSLHPVELHLQDEYFATGTGFSPGYPAGANKSSAPEEKRKPVLLLVEDNNINMKVCLDHKRILKSLLSVIASVKTDIGKAS
jgi:hypothetical protein